jgi:hypothetical protein
MQWSVARCCHVVVRIGFILCMSVLSDVFFLLELGKVYRDDGWRVSSFGPVVRLHAHVRWM